MNTERKVELGLGLIGIGKPWGFVPREVPSESEARKLLESALDLGIRYFDTAASYGVSEERLGKFLRGLSTDQRNRLTIATKFGEHWNAGRGEPYVDHSFGALKQSLDDSMERLRRIDILQLHKTTPAVLASDDLMQAWEYAESLGITRLGASVKDEGSARVVVESSSYGCIQLPFNAANHFLAPFVKQAGANGTWVATNRPFGMGAMLYGETPVEKRDAFAYILRHEFEGVILSGTTQASHLRENWEAFQEAQQMI